MLLKTLRMSNFRQYKGDTKVSFACDKEKNVTIILGDNTFGKTTLLQAFNWCFYEIVMLPNPTHLLNYDVATSMLEGTSTDVEVEIILTHNGMEYILTRTQKYEKRNGVARGGAQTVMKISYTEKDGQTQPISIKDSESVLRSVVNNILPEDLSTYFFFDTERVGNISNRKDLTDSVKGLLGLSVLDNAIKHLGSRQVKRSVLGQFYDAIDTKGDNKAKEFLERIQDAQSRREVITQQLEQVDSEIKYYETRKEQLEVILRDNQSTTALQKKKDDLEKRITNEEKAQSSQSKSYIDDFNSGSLGFYAQPLITQALNLLCEVKIDDKGIKDLTRTTLLEIIERGSCICGTDLSKGSEALEKIKAEMEYVPPAHVGTTVRNYRDALNAFSRNAAKAFSGITSRYGDIVSSRLRIQEWNEELADASEKIRGKENMAKYEKEILDVKARLRELQTKHDRLIREDESKKSDIERYQKLYDNIIDVSGKNRTTMTYIRYAEEILGWLAETYKEKETYIREELEGQVNIIFEKMYHGRRRVSLDSKYQVTLLTTVADQEIASGESEGLNRVKNFAFIAGLVALAKNRIVTQSGEKEIDLSSEPYPLVMDAPFSNADETHTGNISKVLPEIAEQVIMFVMQKDWRYAEPVIENRVGAMYSLNKLSEQHTVLKGESSHV